MDQVARVPAPARTRAARPVTVPAGAAGVAEATGTASSARTARTTRTAKATYTIELSLAPGTVRALAAGGARLCLLRAVGCDTVDGAPLVWAVTSAYTTTTTLTWTEAAYGYAATGQDPDGSPAGARDQRPAGPGQILDVAANALTGIDPEPGDPRYVTVRSTTSTPLACGLAQRAPLGTGVGAAGPAPYCVFPLHRGVFVLLAPLPRVALAFTALPLTAGRAVRHLPGPTVLADMAAGGHVELAYDIDAGWSWQDPNVTAVPLGGLTAALVVPTG